jgi:vancomycin resistance protein YoaR
MSRRLLLAAALVAVAFLVGVAGAHSTERRAGPKPVAPQPVAPRPPAPVPPPRAPDSEQGPHATELVSSFTTHYEPGEPRTLNIRRAAQLLDRTVLEPGETFSMNVALGARTEARGFVAAPQISGGRTVDSVGGGISQVATTLFNAAFFAGLELVSHTPHSFYIDRYPIGREATISWGGPELVFRNDWPARLRMRLRTTPTSVTVRFWSATLGRRVETETGEPFAYVSPQTIFVTNPDLAPGAQVTVQEAGASGFTVEYTRRVFRRGVLLRDERFRTGYEPKNAIVEVGPTRLGGP